MVIFFRKYAMAALFVAALFAGKARAVSFTDEHNDGTLSGWQIYGRQWTESNMVASPVYGSNSQGFLINNNNVNSDGSLSVKITADQWNGDKGGVVFRWSSSSSFYFVAVRPATIYESKLYFAIGTTDLSKAVVIDQKFPVNTTYTLKITMKGSNFNFYIDDIPRGTITNSLYKTGKIGYGYAAEYNDLIDYDRIEWTEEIKSPSNLVLSTISPSKIKCFWMDNAINETAYHVSYKSQNSQLTTIDLPPDSKECTISELVPNTAYTIDVWAAFDASQSAHATSSISTPKNITPKLRLYLSERQPVAPANLTIFAEVSDSDGEVKKVEFFDNTGNLSGTDYEAPFSYSLPIPLAAGEHSLFAMAYDDCDEYTFNDLTFDVYETTPEPVYNYVTFNRAGNLLLTEHNRGLIYEMTPGGQIVRQLDGKFSPILVAEEKSGSMILIEDLYYKMYRISADGKTYAELKPAFSLKSPTWIDIDNSGHILITDSKDKCVYMLNSDGTLNASFGNAGKLILTDPVCAIYDKVRSRIIVAEKSPGEISIFDNQGSFIDKINCVYNPVGLAIEQNGVIYATGEANSHIINKGSLKIINPGSKFVSKQFYNGDAEFGLTLSGIALSKNDSLLVILDSSRNKLCQFKTSSFVPEMYDLKYSTTPTSIIVNYKTSIPTESVLKYGTDNTDLEFRSAEKKTVHNDTINGLTASQRYLVSVGSKGILNDSLSFIKTVPIRTSNATPGYKNVQRIYTAAIVYTDGMNPEQIARVHKSFDDLSEYYFRNSRCNLLLDIKHIDISRTYQNIIDVDNGWFRPEVILSDLANEGFGQENFDQIVTFFVKYSEYGGLGGGTGFSINNREISFCCFSEEGMGYLIHEVNHNIDRIYNMNNYPQYSYNHGTWSVADGELKGYSNAANANILRNVPYPVFTSLPPPFTVLTAKDADNDGIPDVGIFPITEEALHSNPSKTDSDGDAVNDMDELIVGSTHNTSLRKIDTDNDINEFQGYDLTDKNPLLAINRYIKYATPTIDGVVNENEGWTQVSNGINFNNSYLYSSSSPDMNNHLEVKTWTAWDDANLYFAIESKINRGDELFLAFDCQADGSNNGLDELQFNFHNKSSGLEMDVRAGGAERDLMHLIRVYDSKTKDCRLTDGEYGEIYDNMGVWNGGSKSCQLKLPKLINYSDIEWKFTILSDGNYQIEIRIPASSNYNLTPANGQEVGVHLSIGNTPDMIFRDDQFARLLLVEDVDCDFNGVPDVQDRDLEVARAMSGKVAIAKPRQIEGAVAVPGNGKVTLSWLPSKDIITNYVIKRSKFMQPAFEIGRTQEHFFVDTTVQDGTPYFYIISSENSVGEGLAGKATEMPAAD